MRSRSARLDVETFLHEVIVAARNVHPALERKMTMPNERTRSLIQARDFLIDLSGDHLVPESVRLRAFQILRHYPTPSDILLAGKVDEHTTAPFLSSSID